MAGYPGKSNSSGVTGDSRLCGRARTWVLVGGCLEKCTVHTGMPSVFELAVKRWFPSLCPTWQMWAVSEQASVKESGGSLLLLTLQSVLFAHSAGVLRVSKVLGTMTQAEELAWTCCVVEGT